MFRRLRDFFAADQQAYRESIAGEKLRGAVGNAQMYGAKMHFNKDGTADIIDADAGTAKVLNKDGTVGASIGPKGMAV